MGTFEEKTRGKNFTQVYLKVLIAGYPTGDDGTRADLLAAADQESVEERAADDAEDRMEDYADTEVKLAENYFRMNLQRFLRNRLSKCFKSILRTFSRKPLPDEND